MVADCSCIGPRGHAERPGHIPAPYPSLEDYSLNGGTTPSSHGIHPPRLTWLQTNLAHFVTAIQILGQIQS